MQKLPTIGDWVVCHVRPRCEKKLAAYCQQEGIGHFLPVLVSEKIYGNRTRTHTLPLSQAMFLSVVQRASRVS